MITAKSLQLTITSVPVKTEAAFKELSWSASAKRQENGVRLAVGSGADVLALLARATERDLLFLEVASPDDRAGTCHPLVGTTVLVEAADLAQYTLPTLRLMCRGERRQTARALAELARQGGQSIADSAILERITSGRWPQQPVAAVEAAALIPILLRQAEHAAARGESLVIHYGALAGVDALPISWMAAQKRPFIAANVGALALLIAYGVAEGLSRETLSRLLWPGPLIYLLFVLSFLLPLWFVQAVIYIQMSWRGQPHFVAVAGAASLAPERRCRFLLSLRPKLFVLSVLYVESREEGRQWTRPVWLFLGLFATALLAFCLWTVFVPALPPLPALGAITFWSAALIFGLSHLIHGE